MAAFETGVTIIAGTGGILLKDLRPLLLNHFRTEAPALGVQLQELVRNLTPVLTGALETSIDFLTWPNVNDDMDILWLYAEDLLQQQMWHRIYVQYQEGGLLGAPTYTNAPHEMFLTVADVDGPPVVAAWGLNAVQNAIDEWVVNNP